MIKKLSVIRLVEIAILMLHSQLIEQTGGIELRYMHAIV